MGRNPRLVFGIQLIHDALFRARPAGWFATVWHPVIPPGSSITLQPTALLVRGNPRDYARRRPVPGEFAIIVEAADAMLPADGAIKARIYAQHSVPICWLVHSVERRLEVFSGPEGPAYRHHRVLGPGDSVPLILDGREVDHLRVRDLLP